MKKAFLLGAAAAALALSTTAQAVSIQGKVNLVDYYGNTVSEQGSNSNNGLEIAVKPISAQNPYQFTTDDLVPSPGDNTDIVSLFKISTPESSVNLGEDTKLKSIKAQFSFTNPADASGLADTITGNTFGVWGLIQSGKVVWGSPLEFTYGFHDNGKFRLTLLDTDFNSGFLGLGTKGGIVKGKFELLSAAGAVPEPSTWAMMILGVGFAGAAMRRRRETVSVRYA